MAIPPIQFSCHIAPIEENIESLVADICHGTCFRDCVIHLKGFASRLKPNFFLKALIPLTTNKTILVCDGDFLDTESFTMQVAALASMKLSLGFRVAVWLFKYEDKVVDCIKSWTKQVDFVCGEGAELSGASIRDYECGISSGLNQCKVYITPIRDFLEAKLDLVTPNYYASLGIKGLEISGSSTVVAVGGGVCVLEEFMRSRKFSDKIIWYYFPITREGLNGSTCDTCALESVTNDVRNITIKDWDECNGNITEKCHSGETLIRIEI